MRRTLLLVVGALALSLAAPSLASAHGRHHRHHHRHHHKAHRADVTGTAAATVASFDGTTLTLTLANGSTVSGAVSDHTWIVCKAAAPSPTPTATAAHHGGGWGDDDGGWRGGHGDCGRPTPCDASDLVPGATVEGAWLRLGPDGLEFAKVELVSASS